VVGDFHADDQRDGFFVQKEDSAADTNPATSEGLFVYGDTCSADVGWAIWCR
jgi:hypothetical protein